MSILGTFTGNLNAGTVRRLNKERKSQLDGKRNLEASGIFVQFDEDAVQNAVALIVGPAGTPYEGGLYLFEITFPDDYPANPPKVLIRTGDGRVRFNPNLYVEGKVCLSILGTWQGEQWSPAMTLRSVLLSVQSLLNSKPLQNEPGFESHNGPEGEVYARMLRYENLAVSVLQLERPLQKLFASLRAEMVAAFHRNFEAYLKTLAAFDVSEGLQDSCIFGFVTRYAPGALRQRLISLRSALLREAGLPEPGPSSVPPTQQQGQVTTAAQPVVHPGMPQQLRVAGPVGVQHPAVVAGNLAMPQQIVQPMWPAAVRSTPAIVPAVLSQRMPVFGGHPGAVSPGVVTYSGCPGAVSPGVASWSGNGAASSAPMVVTYTAAPVASQPMLYPAASVVKP